MSDALVAGLVFGILTAVLIGTSALDVMRVAVRDGLRLAMIAGAGIASGDGLWAVLAVWAGSTIRRVLLPWAWILQWAAVAVLCGILALAVRELIRGGASSGGSRRESDRSLGLSESPRHVYWVFLSHTVRHPTTVILFGGLIIGTELDDAAGASAAFVIGVFLASLSWQCFLAAVGARRSKDFSDRARRGVLAIDCVLLCLLGVYTAVGLPLV